MKVGAIASLCALLAMPAMAQNPCDEPFPQMLMCNEVIGAEKPFVTNNDGIVSYTVRATGDDDKKYWEHVSYTPAVDIATAAKTQRNLLGLTTVDLYLDEPPFGTLDAAYHFELNILEVGFFKYRTLPHLLKEAKKYADKNHSSPVAYFKMQIGEKAVPVTPDLQADYERIIAAAGSNIKTMHEAYQQKTISTVPLSQNK